MPRYLVTGCAGFIGSHLTDALLAAGHEVVGVDSFTDCYGRAAKVRNLSSALDRAAFEFHESDIAELTLKSLLEGLDGVFHLSARRDPDVQHDLSATRRLLEAAATAEVRVSLMSSSTVYGNPSLLPTPEHSPPDPISPPARLQLASEQLATRLVGTHDLDVVVVRPFTVYGPRQRPDMACSRIAAALRGEAPFTIFGEGDEQTRDYVHVDEVVDATIAAFHRAPRAMTLNLGTGTETPLTDLLALAGEIAGRPVPVRHAPARPDAIGRGCADMRRFRADVGWAPGVALAEGLAEQLEAELQPDAAPAHRSAPTARTAAGAVRMPLVSIVVPTFNGARFLRDSLDSILAQTYPQIEVVVIDDASTDETEEIAGSYGSRISYHRQGQQRGQFTNVNDGIAIARGELVGVYHADDVYHPDIVRREVDWLQRHPELGAVFCKDVFIDADGRAFGRLQLPDELAGGRPLDYETVLRALLTYKNRFLRCPSSMVRAAAYRQVGGYRPEFDIASDLEMWLRLARRYPVAVIDEHLFRYRSGHGSASDQYYAVHRVEREGYFDILDLELEQGAWELADDVALAAYEAHRAEEHLRLAVTNYVLARTDDSRAELSKVRARTILASPQTQRARLLAVTTLMNGLVRVPRIPLAAGLLSEHVFAPRKPSSDPAPRAVT